MNKFANFNKGLIFEMLNFEILLDTDFFSLCMSNKFTNAQATVCTYITQLATMNKGADADPVSVTVKIAVYP